jgi:cytochrome c biogenesis protein CcmG/thiol:disulfide interchange protein DsbE
MRFAILVWAVLVASVGLAGAQEEHLATLKVGSDTYTDVNVTSVTATHVYFTHNRGVGSAKLAELEPSMQQHFRFDPEKAAARQAEQIRANAIYSEAARKVAANKRPVADEAAEAPAAGDEIPPHRIYAKSILNQPSPQVVAEKWLTEAPDARGKFVIVDIWATWCGPCRRSIPHLNQLYAKYKDRLVVVGISDEPEQNIRNMAEPRIDYAVASDTQARVARALEVKGIPHAILIDPKGIVRFEGMPQYLTEKGLGKLMATYGQ